MRAEYAAKIAALEAQHALELAAVKAELEAVQVCTV